MKKNLKLNSLGQEDLQKSKLDQLRKLTKKEQKFVFGSSKSIDDILKCKLPNTGLVIEPTNFSN